jgi:hypothetical protein
LTPPQIISRTDDTEARFQLLVEAVVDYGIFLLDPNGFVMSWNTGAERTNGYRRHEILGRHFSTFYPLEVVASGWPEEELLRARKDGRFEDEGWRVRKDGTRFWANVIITAVHDTAGELTGFVKISRDLTERRRHEQTLLESEQRFRLLVESVRDYAIFMLDVDGTVRSWNAGAQALKGYAADEIIGQHFSRFYTPEDRLARKPEAELQTARVDGRVEDEGWRVRKDSTVFWANVIITAVHGHDGSLIGFAKVTRDMTQRKRFKELERSSRMMSQFLAMLAHELRNPLAPMRNAISLMQLEPMANPVLRESRDIIDRQLSHVTRLVDDLLDIGRLTTGKVRLRKERLQLADVIERSLETARPLADARHHTLGVEVPAELVWLDADPTRLSQILQNLLINAVKFTPGGGRIDIKARARDGVATVSVSDNGRGIAPAEVERMFELFVQGSNDSPSESGLGIGLTLARSLAELHGGRLEATSEGPGHGSTFVLHLPVATEAAVPVPHGGSAGAIGNAQIWRVLVVDDNRDAADTTTAILRLLGNKAACAYDGAGAVEAARHFPADMVLMDLAMPGMDGYRALCKLRALPGMAHVFAVALTGYGRQDDRDRTAAAGFDAHVTKPVELPALLALMKEARARRGSSSPGPDA